MGKPLSAPQPAERTLVAIDRIGLGSGTLGMLRSALPHNVMGEGSLA